MEPCSDTKKRGSEIHTTHLTDSTNPGVHVFLIYFTQFRPFENTQHTDRLLTFADEHHKIKDAQVSCIQHNNKASFVLSIFLPRPLTQMSMREMLSLHCKPCTFPENTSSLFHQKCSQKNTRFPVLPILSLSLSFLFCTSSTDYQAQRKSSSIQPSSAR